MTAAAWIAVVAMGTALLAVFLVAVAAVRREKRALEAAMHAAGATVANERQKAENRLSARLDDERRIAAIEQHGVADEAEDYAMSIAAGTTEARAKALAESIGAEVKTDA